MRADKKAEREGADERTGEKGSREGLSRVFSHVREEDLPRLSFFTTFLASRKYGHPTQ